MYITDNYAELGKDMIGQEDNEKDKNYSSKLFGVVSILVHIRVVDHKAADGHNIDAFEMWC